MIDSIARLSKDQSRRDAIAFGTAFPLALFIVDVLGHTPVSTPLVFKRATFVAQYSHGIYRYRILGRELILGVTALIHSLILVNHSMSAVNAIYQDESTIFVAFVIVNGGALLTFAHVLYRVTVKSQDWVSPFLILVSLTAISGYVVTPYDFLGYLFIALAIVVAFGEWRWSPFVCLLLAVLGTATRESFFVAVAAVVAVRFTKRSNPGCVFAKTDSLGASALVMAVGSMSTYVALRIVMGNSSSIGTILQPPPTWTNFSFGSVVALLIVCFGAFALLSALPSSGVDRSVRLRSIFLFWLLSLPYLIATVIGGIWTEALRLMLPLFIGHYLITWKFSISE